MIPGLAARYEVLEPCYTVKIEMILTVIDMHCFVVDCLARSKKSKTRRAANHLCITRDGVNTLQRTDSPIFNMAIGFADGHVGRKDRR